MSKYLIKILSICAFVILLPLIIIGSSLCVTEALGCTLSILADGVEGRGVGANSEVSIYIDGVKQENNKITVKKHTDVTVTYSGEGYDFQGWYNGNYKEIKENAKAVSTDASYTFSVKGNTVLTAVRNIKTYTATYSGFMDDGTTPVAIEPATREYHYGETLESIVAMSDATFSGWYSGETSDAITTVANWENSGEVTLKPYWSNMMLITYMTKTEPAKLIAQDAVTTQSVLTYTLLSGNDERVQSYLTKGYVFNSWVDENDNAVTTPIEFNLAGKIIYLKESAESYNVNVKFNAKNDSITTLTYSVENGFSAYEVTRTGYTFVGLSYNGNTYTYDSTAKDYIYDTLHLSDALIANNGLDVTAVWKYKYSKYNTEIGGDFAGEAVYGVKEDGTKVQIYDEYLLVFNDEDGYDLKDKVFTCLDGYTKFVDDNGNEITIKSENNISIFANTMGEETFTLTTEQIKNYTYEDLLTYVLNHVSDINNVGQLDITIRFN